MERMNKLFWRNSRKDWCLQHGSSRIKLAESKAEAFAKWHEIMSTGLSVKGEKISLAKVCEQYLEEVKTTRSART